MSAGEVHIREAGPDDTELLVRLRLDFIRMTGADLTPEKEQSIRTHLEAYFRRHIPCGDFVAFLARDTQERVVAAAFMVIGERPAGASFVNGITGTLLNVMTYPGYRGKGYAAALVETAVRKAGELGVTAIDLNATGMGEGLYRKFGFEPLADMAMRLKLSSNSR